MLSFISQLTWQEQGYLGIVFAAAVISTGLAVYAWHYRHKPEAASFGWFMLCIAIWAFAADLLALSKTEAEAQLMSRIEIFTASAAILAFFFFALCYTGRQRWLSWKRIGLLLVIPMLFQLLLWTNDGHQLCFSDLHFPLQGGLRGWAFRIAPFFLAYAVYGYGLVFVGLALMLRMIVRSTRPYRRQAILLYVGIIPAVVTTLIDSIPLTARETAPIGFTLMGIAFAWAIFRHHFLDMVPIARDRLIDSMIDGMIVVDEQDRIIDMNPAAQAILDLSSADIMGQSAIEYLHPWYLQVSQKEMAEAEMTSLQQGEFRVYDVRSSALRDRHGVMSGRLLLLRDISERKQVERTLLKLLHAMETTEVGITITNEQGMIEYVNPAEAAMHGYTVEELLGEMPTIFATPEAKHGARQDDRVEEMYHHWKRESLNRRKDGATFPVELISNPIYDTYKRIIGKVTVCADITFRKRAEAELMTTHDELQRKHRQLQESNASKDKLFSIISHDLRSPFTTLLGFSQLLEEHFQQYSRTQIFEKIVQMRHSAERLYTLLENLLTWSRLQRNIMKFHPTHLLLFAIAETNRDLFAEYAEQKNIRLENTISPTIIVYSDEFMLETILRNLVSNALKFTEAGGTISLSATEEEEWVSVTVADTGVGMTPEFVAGLFCLDAPHSEVGTHGERGTGLGLLLCHELAQKQGGTLQVESELQRGSRFTVRVPRGHLGRAQDE